MDIDLSSIVALSGVSLQEAPAYLCGIHRQLYAPILNFLDAHQSLVGSALTLTGAVWLAELYTKRLKRVDATLEFSKRYHDLMIDRAKLNEESPNDGDAGYYWWQRFFDLMLFQFHFYQYSLLIEELFDEWMWWRHIEYGGQSKDAAGVTYKQGWESYKSRSVIMDNPLIPFLDQIHIGPSSPNEIRKLFVNIAENGD